LGGKAPDGGAWRWLAATAAVGSGFGEGLNAEQMSDDARL
jgi:hypothetical protein